LNPKFVSAEADYYEEAQPYCRSHLDFDKGTEVSYFYLLGLALKLLLYMAIVSVHFIKVYKLGYKFKNACCFTCQLRAVRQCLFYTIQLMWLYINFIVIISLTIFSILNTVSTQDDCGIVLQMDELNLSSSGTCMLFKFSSN
jgi:hypothetical protein